MHISTKKDYNNKTQSDANIPSKKQSELDASFQFKDNRPEAIAQRKLQETADNHIEKQPKQKKANNTGLPNHLKSGIENLSGYSMDDVKVYYNSNKPTQLQAHAYAQGTNIHIASGQERHLPHEAWHVVQQKQGRVRPTRQMKGKININDDAGLEKEADVMGQKAFQYSGTRDKSLHQFKSFNQLTENNNLFHNQLSNKQVVQRWIKLSSIELSNEENLAQAREKTKELFNSETGKPIGNKFFILKDVNVARQKVAEALEFLKIQNTRTNKGFIVCEDIDSILTKWMGVPNDLNKIDKKDLDKDILKEQEENTKGWDKRASAGVTADMRFYINYLELTWALVQESGLQAMVSKPDHDIKPKQNLDEKLMAHFVLRNPTVYTNVNGALNKIYEKAGEISWEFGPKSPNYGPFHEIRTLDKFKESYKLKYKPKSTFEATSIIHDLKDYLANSNHALWRNVPKEINLSRDKKEKDGSPKTFKITKETMRYNLGTVDEADPYILFMRERGRPVWAGPSYTTLSMLEIVKSCGGSHEELTAVALGIFALWAVKYPNSTTPFHTYHEVMSGAQMYGIPFNPNLDIKQNIKIQLGLSNL